MMPSKSLVDELTNVEKSRESALDNSLLHLIKEEDIEYLSAQKSAVLAPKSRGLEQKCYQCSECGGSGSIGENDKYIVCPACNGFQCFNFKTKSYFRGKCDGSCGEKRYLIKV